MCVDLYSCVEICFVFSSYGTRCFLSIVQNKTRCFFLQPDPTIGSAFLARTRLLLEGRLVNSQINTVANKRLKRQVKNTRVYVRININSISISIYYTMSFVTMIAKYQLGTFRYFFLEFFLGVDQLMEDIYKN